MRHERTGVHPAAAPGMSQQCSGSAWAPPVLLARTPSMLPCCSSCSSIAAARPRAARSKAGMQGRDRGAPDLARAGHAARRGAVERVRVRGHLHDAQRDGDPGVCCARGHGQRPPCCGRRGRRPCGHRHQAGSHRCGMLQCTRSALPGAWHASKEQVMPLRCAGCLCMRAR